MQFNTMKSFIATLVALTSVAGCSENADDSMLDDHTQSLTLAAEETIDLDDLAWRYLYQPLGKPEDAQPILDEIRRLDHDAQRAFRDIVFDLQLEDEEITDELLHEIEVARRLHDELSARGIHMLDATESEVDSALMIVAERMHPAPEPLLSANPGDPTAACSSGQVPCVKAYFGGKVTTVNACPLSILAPTGYDRKDNDVCASGECDYRFRFSVGGNQRDHVKSMSAATWCALWYNDGKLLSDYAYGAQWVLVGYGATKVCNVLPGKVQNDIRIF